MCRSHFSVNLHRADLEALFTVARATSPIVVRRRMEYSKDVMWWFSVVAVSVLLAAAPANAEPGSSDKAAAEALFAEGRTLMQAGRLPEACGKFEASQRLDPGVGTMLNLAECYEKSGRTASAWAEFREAISAARAADSKDREDLARQRAQALEAKLSRLTLTLSPEASATPGIEAKRDGVVVDAAELGSAIPMDPGKHSIEVNAPGKAGWSTTVELASDGAELTVTVPALLPEQGAAVPADSNAAAPRAQGSGQRTAALVTGGVGVIGVALGTVFGVKSSSSWKEAKSACTDYPYGCSSTAEEKRSSAKSAGTLSTIGFIGGGALLAAGTVLWFTAPSGEQRTTTVGIGPSGFAVRGTF